jgi:hypothetical protein
MPRAATHLCRRSSSPPQGAPRLGLGLGLGPARPQPQRRRAPLADLREHWAHAGVAREPEAPLLPHDRVAAPQRPPPVQHAALRPVLRWRHGDAQAAAVRPAVLHLLQGRQGPGGWGVGGAQDRALPGTWPCGWPVQQQPIPMSSPQDTAGHRHRQCNIACPSHPRQHLLAGLRRWGLQGSMPGPAFLHPPTPHPPTHPPTAPPQHTCHQSSSVTLVTPALANQGLSPSGT